MGIVIDGISAHTQQTLAFFKDKHICVVQITEILDCG